MVCQHVYGHLAFAEYFRHSLGCITLRSIDEARFVLENIDDDAAAEAVGQESKVVLPREPNTFLVSEFAPFAGPIGQILPVARRHPTETLLDRCEDFCPGIAKVDEDVRNTIVEELR